MSTDHFSTVAKHYAAFRPEYPAAVYQWLNTLCPAQSSVWDVGCGSGQATRALAEHFSQVIATDISATQLAQAEVRANIEYLCAGETCAAIADDSIDLITVAQALHWFDLPLFYAEVKRVLKPSGLLAVWTYSPISLPDEKLNQVVQDYYDTIAKPWWPPGREHVDNGYRDLPFPFPELPDPGIAMTHSMTIDSLCGYVRTWSASARYLEAMKTDPTEILRQHLSKQIAEHQPFEVCWRLRMRAGRRS